MNYLIINKITEGVKQLHNSNLIDLKYGCFKIKDYRKKRMCRLEMKIRILHKRFRFCKNDACRLKIQQQIAKWQAKYKQEMMKSPTNINPEKIR